MTRLRQNQSVVISLENSLTRFIEHLQMKPTQSVQSEAAIDKLRASLETLENLNEPLRSDKSVGPDYVTKHKDKYMPVFGDISAILKSGAVGGETNRSRMHLEGMIEHAIAIATGEIRSSGNVPPHKPKPKKQVRVPPIAPRPSLHIDPAHKAEMTFEIFESELGHYIASLQDKGVPNTVALLSSHLAEMQAGRPQIFSSSGEAKAEYKSRVETVRRAIDGLSLKEAGDTSRIEPRLDAVEAAFKGFSPEQIRNGEHLAPSPSSSTMAM